MSPPQSLICIADPQWLWGRGRAWTLRSKTEQMNQNHRFFRIMLQGGVLSSATTNRIASVCERAVCAAKGQSFWLREDFSVLNQVSSVKSLSTK